MTNLRLDIVIVVFHIYVFIEPRHDNFVIFYLFLRTIIKWSVNKQQYPSQINRLCDVIKLDLQPYHKKIDTIDKILDLNLLII